MKTKFAQLVIRILGYIAILGWIVIIIFELIDGEYFIAIGSIGFLCLLGLGILVPQWFKKNQP